METETMSGHTLWDFVSPQDTSVLIVIDPEECFTCYTNLSIWRDWGKQNPDRFALILTREPRTVEKRGMVRLRIDASAIMKRAPGWAGPGVLEIIATRDSVLMTERVRPGRLTSAVQRAVGLGNH